MINNLDAGDPLRLTAEGKLNRNRRLLRKMTFYVSLYLSTDLSHISVFEYGPMLHVVWLVIGVMCWWLDDCGSVTGKDSEFIFTIMWSLSVQRNMQDLRPGGASS